MYHVVCRRVLILFMKQGSLHTNTTQLTNSSLEENSTNVRPQNRPNTRKT